MFASLSMWKSSKESMMNFETPYYSIRGEILVHGGDLVNAERLGKQSHDRRGDYDGKICGVFAGRHYSVSVEKLHIQANRRIDIHRMTIKTKRIISDTIPMIKLLMNC